MELNTLSSSTKRLPSRRVGRGGKRGKTSGRGTKGQNARAGHKKRPEIRDMIKKLPKRRGYRAPNIGSKAILVSLSALDKAFENGATVTPQSILGKGLIRKGNGKVLVIKILGAGEITKKLSISDCLLSTGAREKIIKAGGSIADAPAL